MSNAAATAANLRWRARVTKDAALETDALLPVNNHSNTNGNTTKPSTRNKTPVMWWTASLAATMAVCSSLWNLQLVVTFGLSSSGPFWLLHSIWIVLQSTLLLIVAAYYTMPGLYQLQYYYLSLPMARQRRTSLQTRLASLQVWNERLCRHLTVVLDPQVERLRTVHTELLKYNTNTPDTGSATSSSSKKGNSESSIQELTRLTTEYRLVQGKMRDHLVYRCQETILQAYLSSTTSASTTSTNSTSSNIIVSWELTGPETERLILALQNICVLREEQLRYVLSEQKEQQQQSVSGVIQLLQQVVEDARHPERARVFEFAQTLAPTKPDLLLLR